MDAETIEVDGRCRIRFPPKLRDFAESVADVVPMALPRVMALLGRKLDRDIWFVIGDNWRRLLLRNMPASGWFWCGYELTFGAGRWNSMWPSSAAITYAFSKRALVLMQPFELDAEPTPPDAAGSIERDDAQRFWNILASYVTHEIAHVLVTPLRFPKWLDEGVAHWVAAELVEGESDFHVNCECLASIVDTSETLSELSIDHRHACYYWCTRYVFDHARETTLSLLRGPYVSDRAIAGLFSSLGIDDDDLLAGIAKRILAERSVGM